MKKPTLLLVFACIYFMGYGQYDWATIGTQWYYEYSSDYNPNQNGYSYRIVDRDTILNGISCRVIENQRFWVTGNTFMGESYTYESNDSIFYYNHDLNEFKLHFIRGLQIGDTLALPNNANELITCVITKNDFMTFDDVPLEFWELEYIDDSTYYIDPCGITNFFIDGIGTINTVPYGCIFVYFIGSELRCFFDDNISYQTVMDCDSIEILDGLKEQEFTEASIFPNPSTGSISFSVENGIRIESLMIFDAAGKSVFHKESLSAQSPISLDGLNNSLYYFLLNVDGHFQNGKFVLSK